jgi:hypothetical protein
MRWRVPVPWRGKLFDLPGVAVDDRRSEGHGG